ncbi:MAG: sigma-70 family RNA polymerase sigma factor [Planctomycetaceae bacterium]
MWPDSLTTNELLHEAGAGNARAVDRLLDRHRQALLQLVRYRLDRKIATRIDASDVVQDVLLEASRRLADYIKSPEIPFHLWLRGLARDRMIDVHRRHRLAERRSVDREQHQASTSNNRSGFDLMGALGDPGITPAAAAIRRELAVRFRDAIDQLDELDREIVLMRHVEMLTNSEAAQALGLSAPAAGMRYLRALRRLRDLLGPQESMELSRSILREPRP